MRQDILDLVERKTESRIGENRGFVDDNPMYEDPRDVIGKNTMNIRILILPYQRQCMNLCWLVAKV